MIQYLTGFHYQNRQPMINEVLFKHRQGAGYIADQYEEVFTLQIHDDQLILGSQTLTPDCMTTLDGFFDVPTKYVGFKLTGTGSMRSKEMIFYLGEDSGKHYFKSIYWIAENEIVIQYMHNGMRDYNYKLRKGKMCWK